MVARVGGADSRAQRLEARRTERPQATDSALGRPWAAEAGASADARTETPRRHPLGAPHDWQIKSNQIKSNLSLSLSLSLSPLSLPHSLSLVPCFLARPPCEAPEPQATNRHQAPSSLGDEPWAPSISCSTCAIEYRIIRHMPCPCLAHAGMKQIDPKAKAMNDHSP